MKYAPKPNLHAIALTALLMLCALFGAADMPAGGAAQTADSVPFIVQGSSADQARTAVLALGGEITHELGIINAVGANLTISQRAALLAHAGLQLYADSTVDTAADTATVRDEFATIAYDNNDGTTDWAGPWVELNDYNGASGGDILVVAPQRLRMRRPDKAIQRALYLPDGSLATLRFDYQRTGLLLPAHFVTLEVSSDGGGTWTELDRFAGPAEDLNPRLAEYDISAFASPDTVIRFATSSAMGPQTLPLRRQRRESNTRWMFSRPSSFRPSKIASMTRPTAAATAPCPGADPWIEVGDDNDPFAGHIVLNNKGFLQVSEREQYRPSGRRTFPAPVRQRSALTFGAGRWTAATTMSRSISPATAAPPGRS